MERARVMDTLCAMQDYAWNIRRQKAIKWTMSLFFHPRTLLWKFKFLIYYKLLGVDRVSQLREKLNLMAQRYKDIDEECVSRLTFCANRKDRLSSCVPRRFLEELTTVEFEGYKFTATKHWEEYLIIFYGNWRKQVIARDPSGDAFIDLDNSYTKYI
jgi:phosphorylcholine metabolism protein LicD